ncbi:MAG: hypothetical protein PHU36_09975 [Syntrophomonadaceae bacterium]|nr:hypothetical protein [Syntrophomonadaceae bacterium]NLV21776.1 hypothetical protein [Syntrophomonadaceae bacterium]
MDKLTLLKALIIAIMVYYLMKGILYLILWQVLSKAEENSKERAEKAKSIIMEQRRRRDEREAQLAKERREKKFY